MQFQIFHILQHRNRYFDFQLDNDGGAILSEIDKLGEDSRALSQISIPHEAVEILAHWMAVRSLEPDPVVVEQREPMPPGRYWAITVDGKILEESIGREYLHADCHLTTWKAIHPDKRCELVLVTITIEQRESPVETICEQEINRMIQGGEPW